MGGHLLSLNSYEKVPSFHGENFYLKKIRNFFHGGKLNPYGKLPVFHADNIYLGKVRKSFMGIILLT